MADRVKIYEETKKRTPVLAWLLPLLLLLALLAYFLTRHHTADNGPTTGAAVAAPAFPDLGSIHFDTDKATITPEGQATLQQAAAAMKANPSSHLRIEGFTDSTGSAPHNADLSEQRALAVAAYLKGQGIDGNRLTGGGFGPGKPIDTNATPDGKADNRRVELFSQQ